MSDAAQNLREGLVKLGLSLSESQQQQLLDYLGLLQKWGKVYNLTAVRRPEEMLTHHLLDSLAVVLPLRRELASQGRVGEGSGSVRLLDVGSGAGLPGVVLAICCPQIQVTCVDTVGKKAAFVQQVAMQLHLSNLQGLHARVETLSGPYDVVSARAFAALADLVAWSANAIAPHGLWLAMKGKHPEQELQVLPSTVQVFHVEPITVPGLDAERCIVWMRPQSA